MNSVIDAIRTKYPQYNDVSDEELTIKIGEKYPAYLDRPDFKSDYDRLSYTDTSEDPPEQTTDADAASSAAISAAKSGAGTVTGGISQLGENPLHDFVKSRFIAPVQDVYKGFQDAKKEVEDFATKPLFKISEKLPLSAQTVADAVDVIKAGSSAMVGTQKSGEQFLESAGTPQREPNKVEKIVAGGDQAVMQSLDFFTSPLGIATLGTGALPATAQKAIALAFTADMVSTYPDQIKNLSNAWESGDTEGVSKSLVGLGLTTAFVGMGAKSLKPEATPLEVKLEENNAPLTANALKEVNETLAKTPEPVAPDAAGRLEQLKNKPNPTPEDLAEQTQLQAKSDSVRAKQAPILEQLRAQKKAQTEPPISESATPSEPVSQTEGVPTNLGEQTPSVVTEPIKAYHFTTEKPFDRFDESKIGSSVGHKDPVEGFYLTTNPKYKGNIPEGMELQYNRMDATVNFKNPLRLKNYSDVDKWGSTGESARKAIEKAGYDGVIFSGGDEIVAFKPEQVKFIKSENPTKFRVGNSPQLWTEIERPKATESEIANKEQPVRVRNDKTGEEQIVMESDLTPVKERVGEKPKKTTKAELDDALRKAGLEPSVFPDAKSKKNALERADAKLAELQRKIRGSSSNISMGVPKAVLDLAIQSARVVLKTTNSMAKAVAAAIDYVRKNHTDKFDEDDLRGMIVTGLNEERPALSELTQSINTLADAKGKPKQTEAFNLGEKTAEVKDGVTEFIKGLVAAGKYAKQRLINRPKVDDYTAALGDRHLSLTESSINARKFVESAEKKVPDKTTREAISNWIDTGGDIDKLKQAEAETKPKYKAGYRKAQNLSPDEIKIAQAAQDYFETRLKDAQEAGIFEEGIEDYIHRTYESDSPWKSGMLAELRSGVFTGKPALARQRVFEYDFEAEKAGYKPIKSFIKRIAAYDLSLNKAIADRQLVKDMMKIKMPDGRPMIDTGGVGVPVGENETIPEATLINPHYRPFGKEGTVVSTDQNRGDYRAYDYPALRKWKWVAKDSGGKPIFVKGDVLIHPDAISRVKVLFEPSAIRRNLIGRAALGLSSVVKQTMLDISGFHPTQITVHGWEHRTDVPFSKATARLTGREFKPLDELIQDPKVKGLIQGGLVAGDTRGYELFSEGLAGSSLTKYIPKIGPKLQEYSEWLFNDYIPRLKIATGLHALERNKQRFPNLSEAELNHLTANQMNAAFGELNYEMLGRSKTTQDALRLAFLAPDFLEARGRFSAQAATKFGREQFTALALGAATLYITARIINKLLDDEWHFEAKNAFSVVYNKKAYSLRTVQGDLLHLATSPAQFTYNRLNPVYGRTLLEFLTSRDSFGRKRDGLEQLQDLIKTVVPISLKGLGSGGEQSLWESFINAFGITERRSSAADTIFELADKYRKAHGVSEPGEFIYDKDKDPYRSIKVAANYGSESDIVEAIKRTMDKGEVDMPHIIKHFERYAIQPFTGSQARDDEFYQSLSADNKKIYNDAKKERSDTANRFFDALNKYLDKNP